MTQIGGAGFRARSEKRLITALLASTAIAIAVPAFAQDADGGQAQTGAATDQVDEIVVTGIRASLQNALSQKRNADNLVEVIEAEDIGKLPDQNLAEVLENVTGIQITREAGVGRGVQIRGRTPTASRSTASRRWARVRDVRASASTTWPRR